MTSTYKKTGLFEKTAKQVLGRFDPEGPAKHLLRIAQRVKAFVGKFGADDTEYMLPEDYVRPIYVSTVFDLPEDAPDFCVPEQLAFSVWLSKTFNGVLGANLKDFALNEFDRAKLDSDLSARRLNPSRLRVTTLPLAILEIPNSHEDYFSLIGPKSRNMVRKAAKKGYTFSQFHHNDYLDDIFEINTSKEERQGQKMTAGYLERPDPIGDVLGSENQIRLFYGGFNEDGKLVCYSVIPTLSSFAYVSRILGHGDYLNDGIMNGLIDFMVRDMMETGQVKYFNYLTLLGRKNVNSFKERVGFEARHLVFLPAEQLTN